MEAAKFALILTKQLLNVFCKFLFVEHFSVKKLEKEAEATLFPIISFITSLVFWDIIFIWINKIWIIIFLWFLFSKFQIVFCIVYNWVPFLDSYSSNIFHTIFCFLFDDFPKLLVIQGLLKLFRLIFIFYFGILFLCNIWGIFLYSQ